MLHGGSVGDDLGQLGLKVDLEGMVVGQRHEVVAECVHQGRDVSRRRECGEFLVAHGQPPQVLEVVDEDAQLVDLPVHTGDYVEATVVGEELPVVAQHLAVARHDRHQVADLVTEHPQEVVGGEPGERIVACVAYSHVRRRWSPPAKAA